MIMLDLAHLESIKVDDSWDDCGRDLVFTGRTDFVSKVNEQLVRLRTAPVDKKESVALVYSSVSGSGKTISMLELKSRLKEVTPDPIVVAYLGFNTNLELSGFEKEFITNKFEGAERVLARRLAAATIISMVNPEVVAKLPHYKTVYNGYGIPTVDESKQLILDHTGANREEPVYIVAGVDEVQLLNRIRDVEGLGKLFLRILRGWQHSWHKEGIRLLPLGTGIAVDWVADQTTGFNIPLNGGDTTLISKRDFRELVEGVVRNLDDFRSRFSNETTKETVVDLIAACYWPRIRLLQWWRDNNTTALCARASDSNADQWVKWLCYWLREESMSVDKHQESVPGKNDSEGQIICLFELSDDARKFSVIPDGYSVGSIIESLMEKLPVPLLYEGLSVIQSLVPQSFCTRDTQSFENLGFSTVGSAIHVGLYALNSAITAITLDNASQTQKKRLGLALWFREKKAVVCDQMTGRMHVPKILGPTDSSGTCGAFYPFTTHHQTQFQREVLFCLRRSAKDFSPVYIRCGRITCCDYLYIYISRSQNGVTKFLCNICDAKHTSATGVENVSTEDQSKLFHAADKVGAAFKSGRLALIDVRLLLVTNRDGLAEPRNNKDFFRSKKNAQKRFSNVALELLNNETFEFGPFSDILAARRKA
jgi:hypothetical protein